MRIGWASPFHERSAIARYSLRVCEELRRRGVTVEVLRTETGPMEKLPALDGALAIYPPTDFAAEFLASHFDLCVVNVADDATDHRRALEIVRRFQSVTILHRYGSEGRGQEASSAGNLTAHTGRIGWAALQISLSTGAVVHDHRDFDALGRMCAGPVAAIPMEFQQAPGNPPAVVERSGLDAAATAEGCVEKYVDALLEVLDEALRRAPLRNAGWTIGATVAEMGLAWDDPLSSRLGDEMFALFEESWRG